MYQQWGVFRTDKADPLSLIRWTHGMDSVPRVSLVWTARIILEMPAGGKWNLPMSNKKGVQSRLVGS